MLTQNIAVQEAEKAIDQYTAALGLSTPEDIKLAMEAIIAGAARGIEKHCGKLNAVKVLSDVLENVEHHQPGSWY